MAASCRSWHRASICRTLSRWFGRLCNRPAARLQDLDAIAVTEGPGLAGALLVGVMYAKGLAFALKSRLIAVNHLEGHIHAVLMEARKQQQALPQPTLALVVSGGHTHLYLAEEIRVRGSTETSAKQWMMPPAKPLTKWPSCWGSAIPVGPGLIGWRSMGIRRPFLWPNSV